MEQGARGAAAGSVAGGSHDLLDRDQHCAAHCGHLHPGVLAPGSVDEQDPALHHTRKYCVAIACVSAVRRAPAGSRATPKRSSASVMTVVHSSAIGTARAQAKTVGAGVLRASSDSTLVSSRITARVRQTPYSGPEKSGGGRLPCSRTSWKSCPPSGAKMARMASASVSVAEPGGAADLNLSKSIQRASSASDRPWRAASARKRARVSSSRSGITRVLTTTRLLTDGPRCGAPSCCQTILRPRGATGEWRPGTAVAHAAAMRIVTTGLSIRGRRRPRCASASMPLPCRSRLSRPWPLGQPARLGHVKPSDCRYLFRFGAGLIKAR